MKPEDKQKIDEFFERLTEEGLKKLLVEAGVNLRRFNDGQGTHHGYSKYPRRIYTGY